MLEARLIGHKPVAEEYIYIYIYMHMHMCVILCLFTYGDVLICVSVCAPAIHITQVEFRGVGVSCLRPLSLLGSAGISPIMRKTRQQKTKAGSVSMP